MLPLQLAPPSLPNYSSRYRALRLACNISHDGYLWHEAVHWDVRTRRWYFLPRKASQTAYHPHSDQWKGTNILLVASENFADIRVHRIGPLEPEYGFTSLKKIPGSQELFMALKVREVLEDPNSPIPTTHTKLCIFDLDGNLYLEQPAADQGRAESHSSGSAGFAHVSHLKFEGLEFL